MTLVEWFDKHKGVAAAAGAFASVTAGATYWLAKGGAAAFFVSMTALSDAEIADTLAGLPDYHARTEETLADLVAGQQQIADILETFRADNEKVVEWAPDHSQRLTDAVGGCYAGEDCTVYFRGRRTQAGQGCDLVAERPRLLLPDGREFPVSFKGGIDVLELTTTFQTVEAVVPIPAFIPAGLIGVVVWTLYSDCPFARDGETVERETFRLLVQIKEPN